MKHNPKLFLEMMREADEDFDSKVGDVLKWGGLVLLLAILYAI